MVDVSEHSRFVILTFILQGWKEITKSDIPRDLVEKLKAMVSKLDDLLQSLHLDEVSKLAYWEGVSFAKEQVA